MLERKLTNLKIITPSGIFFDAKVPIVTVKTTEGEMGILHGKTPLVAALTIANLYIGPKSESRECAIAGGLLYVTPEGATIITDAIEYKDKIDLARAERARLEAVAVIKMNEDRAAILQAKIALERALNRIHVKTGMFDEAA